MKLKLIRQVFGGDRESWKRLSLFEVVEGAAYAPPPESKAHCDTVYDAVYDEMDEALSFTGEKVIAEVAARLGISVEWVRKLRYWPEIEDWEYLNKWLAAGQPVKRLTSLRSPPCLITLESLFKEPQTAAA